jgi:hypothetical protein
VEQKFLTMVPVAMFIVLITVLWDTDRIGQDPMGNPAYRFMIRIIKTGDHYRQCRVAFRLWPFLSQCQLSERTHYRGCPHHAVGLVRAHYVGVCKQRQLDRRFPTFLGARLCRSTDFFASRSCQVRCPSSARHSITVDRSPLHS